MSKPAKFSTRQPLRGIRVLVGRARHQAGSLSAELRARGARVLEIPFIEIRRPRSFQPLDSALNNLATYDWLILTSVNGVEAMWARLERLDLANPGSSPKHRRKSKPGLGFLLLPWKSGPLGPRPSPHNSRAEAPVALRIAARGPATWREERMPGMTVETAG